MQIDKVVVNASPLITLFRSGQAGLLPQLFQKIIVPGAVWTEVTGGERDDPAARELIVQPWPIREIVMTSPRVAVWNLGDGETSVLSYALENPACRAVVDDAEARRCARTLGIRMLGTGGVLILAKQRGLIVSVAEGLNRLRQAGLWLSDDVAQLLLKLAGE
jgi:predicted nucleic acid-binding protein